MPTSWTIKRVDNGVHRIEFGGVNYPELWAFLSSDWHWDNPKTRLDLIERDLRIAKKLGGCVIVAGDVLCLMQGKYDKRSNKDDLRPEHATGSYLDRVVDTFVEFLSPYVDTLALMSLGNHETAIYGRHETCLLTRVVERLRLMGSPVQRGGYNGWVQFVARSKSGGSSHQWKLYYHHGSGGASPVTQGLLGMNRVAQYVDSDAILSGHIHTKNLSMVCRERISSHGKRSVNECALIRTSTYKDEYQPLAGFHVEKGGGPRPVIRPGYWLRLKMSRQKEMVNTSFHDEPPGEFDDAGRSHGHNNTRGRSVPDEPARRKRKSTKGSSGTRKSKSGGPTGSRSRGV